MTPGMSVPEVSKLLEQRMKNESHLTKGYGDALARQINSTVPGMAHWAGSGPADADCSQCKFFGYAQSMRNAAGEIITSKFRKTACGKFHELTGKHGPDIRGSAKACRHFEPRSSTGA